MTNFFTKMRVASFAAIALAAAACDDKDEAAPVPPPSGFDAIPVELTVSSGYYYGQGDALSCDHYKLYLSNGAVVQQDQVFSGKGTGVCLDIYSPISQKMGLPDGSYEVRQPLIQSWLNTVNPKSETDSSYLYLGPDTKPLGILSGTISVDHSGANYTISGTVACSDGKHYALGYEGALNLKDESLPSEWLTEYADYREMPRCAGIYFGTLMVDTHDNYSLYLMSEEIIDLGGSFDGAGTAVSFDLYAPLGTGVDPANGVYTVFNADDPNATLDFKYKPGEDYGAGMLQGSFIFNRASPNAEKEYVYITGGTLSVESKNGYYRILIHVQGNDGDTHKFKYVGESLNMLDPFAGM